MGQEITWEQIAKMLAIIAPIGGLISWIYGVYKRDINLILKENKELRDKMQALELNMAQSLVTKEDFKQFRDEIVNQLTKIYDRLDRRTNSRQKEE